MQKLLTFFQQKKKGSDMDIGVKVKLISLSLKKMGPVVQSIVSSTSLLRGPLVKCFMTL